jgi:trigger factor
VQYNIIKWIFREEPFGGNVKVSVEKLPTSEAALDIEISWDEMEKASEKAYRKLVQKVDVQGFRRGKAPRSLLERKLGKEYIYQEGLDDLISEIYRDTLKEHELTPISQPKLDAPGFELGQPYHFSLTVPIITPVVLGDYHSPHFDREEVDVTSEDVDKELEALRGRLAEWTIVERPADYNDRVTVDLKLTSGDQNISDLKDNPFELTKERHGLFVGMDEQVVGMQTGETKSFTTTIPQDYSNTKLAGKQADYTVTLHKVEEKHLPELDDAFAVKVSENEYQTIEDLSKGVSDNILENKKRRVRDELREKVLDAIIEQAQITIHPLLIDEEVEEMEHRLSHSLEHQHLSMDQYLMMIRKNREEFRNDLRPDAEKRVKRTLVLDEVAQKENINVEAAELEQIFRAYAQAGEELPQTEAQIRALAISYRQEKTLSRLVELTTDPDPDAESYVEEAEEAAVENAEAAALVSENVLADDLEVENKIEASVEATSLPGEPTAEKVE